MRIRSEILIGLLLIVFSPYFIWAAYLERGYWAYGSEYGIIGLLCFIGIKSIIKGVKAGRMERKENET